MRRIVFALAATLLTAALAQVDPRARGRELSRAFYAGDVQAVFATFSAEMAELVGGEEGLRAFVEQVLLELGDETVVVEEQLTEVEGLPAYVRLARFGGYGGPVQSTWVFGPYGDVVGFWVQYLPPTEPAPSNYLDHRTVAELRLPFDGEWTVDWGGRDVEGNYHAAYRAQRFALDLVVVRDGSTHVGEGLSNDDYHCYGRPVLAPGAGVVVTAVDGLPDNVPGHFGDEAPLGNHVVIDHGTGEHSFIAHLREGSVRVRAGDVVAAGDVVGECGNSGRSSEPHLHFHLQDAPGFGAGEGMPAQFVAYVADGVFVARGEPVRGQTVSPAGR